MTSVIALIGTVLSGCQSHADDPASGGPTEPSAVNTPDPASGRILSYQLPGMSTIVPETVTYSTAKGMALELDLYRPHGDVKAPVVLLLHGVAPDASPKNFGGFVGWGQALAQSGLAAAVINYRATEEGAGPGNEDVHEAIEHLESLRGVDATRLGLLTFSAGGPYGVRAASRHPEGLRALGFFYARTEPVAGPRTPETSLSALVRRDPDLPVFAAYGKNDQIPGIRESARALRETAGRLGGRAVTVRTHPDAGHAFDIQPDEPSRDVVESGVAFFVENLL